MNTPDDPTSEPLECQRTTGDVPHASTPGLAPPTAQTNPPPSPEAPNLDCPHAVMGEPDRGRYGTLMGEPDHGRYGTLMGEPDECRLYRREVDGQRGK
jgi:hypothetical protein